jgi:hypothetical protein
LGHGHLLNAAQALIIWMTDQFQDQRMVYGDESVNRIVDDFLKAHGRLPKGLVKVKEVETQSYAALPE